MKLCEIRGEHALDVLADIMDPAIEIFQDETVVNQIKGGQKLRAIKTLLKDHKKPVIEIMAYLDGKDPETYQPSMLRLPAMLLDILNDPEFIELFSSGVSKTTSSGSPTVNTEVEEK